MDRPDPYDHLDINSRVNPLQSQTRIQLSGRCLVVLAPLFRRARTSDGEDRLQLSRILQRLSFGRRNTRTRKEYSAQHVSLDRWHCGYLYRDAALYSRHDTVAGSTALDIYI